MAFSTFKIFFKYHFYSVPKYIHHCKIKPLTNKQFLSTCTLPWAPNNHQHTFYLFEFNYSGYSYHWDHMTCDLLFLASFTSHNVLEVFLHFFPLPSAFSIYCFYLVKVRVDFSPFSCLSLRLQWTSGCCLYVVKDFFSFPDLRPAFDTQLHPTEKIWQVWGDLWSGLYRTKFIILAPMELLKVLQKFS